MSNFKAIETRYKGYRFRSRLEARWAVFFDMLRIKWLYELQGYRLSTGECYLPDFHLPEIGVRGKGSSYLEIKPKYCEDEYRKFATFLEDKSEKGIFIACGEVTNECCGEMYEAPQWDNCMMLVQCQSCGKFKFEFSESNYMHCPFCNGCTAEDTDQILMAIEAARSARFEHGETPK